MSNQVDEEKYKPPEASKGDVVHTLAKAGIASLPWIGGPGAEIFAFVVLPPLERRRQEWMEEVGEALGKLEQAKGIKLEELRENGEFIDVVILATQVALRNGQEEKRAALRNAILNSALPHSPDESLQQFFIQLVDEFTVWYLRILKLFQNPHKWAEINNHKFPSLHSGALSHVLASAFPELGGSRGFYDQIWKDLNNRGLTNTPSLHVMMTATGLMEGRTSELGNQFLRFIEEPE